jgi:hypothetical protein
MSNENETNAASSTEYDYTFNDAAITKADKNAARVTEGGAYLGHFNSAAAITTDGGAKGIEFEFENNDGGKVNFTVYTVGKSGQATFGADQVAGLHFLLGGKGTLRGAPGKVMKWDGPDGHREKVEADGTIYPSLIGKPIGLILEKELTGKRSDAGEKFRFNLYGAFDTTTKLTASEIKERKSVPQKVDKMLRGLKTRDGRKGDANEPGQPSIGASLGDGY